jgi:peptidoglycan/xylan/chitin deacetylase (PgdA/CDA1 family)
MTERGFPDLAALPLLLFRTPPALELILAQEGVPFETVETAHPLSFRCGRFVLYDGRAVPGGSLLDLLTPNHVPIDVDRFRRGEPCDPFAALADTRSARAAWRVGAWDLTERVARHPKAWIRMRLIEKVRDAVSRCGGVWVRLAPFPYPYRSAFAFRADLDEPLAEDYHRFVAGRAALADCCTHFVSTHAYVHHKTVMKELRDYDTQSHGHYHHVYRDPATNRLNLERADRILRSFGVEPVGFAGPHGRWSRSTDDAMEELGYLYSSDFQLGYDDLPFFPWKGDRFSRVLQIPVHPVCEGLFLEAGVNDPQVIGEYLGQFVGARLDAGELAIAYGHPERRLGRMPEIVAILARAVAARALVWRVTFSELARWWRWRLQRRWMVIAREGGRLDVRFDEWDTTFDCTLEIHKGPFRCALPVTGPRMSLGLAGLAFERSRALEPILDPPRIDPAPLSLRRAVQTAIDWETVTPFNEIPGSTLPNRVKRGLRWWKHRRARVGS